MAESAAVKWWVKRNTVEQHAGKPPVATLHLTFADGVRELALGKDEAAVLGRALIAAVDGSDDEWLFSIRPAGFNQGSADELERT